MNRQLITLITFKGKIVISLSGPQSPPPPTLSLGAFSVSLRHTTQYHLSLSLYLDLYFEIISRFCRLHSLNTRHALHVRAVILYFLIHVGLLVSTCKQRTYKIEYTVPFLKVYGLRIL
jgi:hypothetical protein